MKKTWFIFISALLVSGTLVYFYPNRYFAAVFYLLVCIPVFSLINIIYVLMRFKITHDINTGRIIKGDTVIYTCSIHNEDVIPYPEMKVIFEGEHLIFHDQVISPSFVLTPRSRYDIDISLSCKYRGTYNIGVNYVEMTDYFNLFRLRFRNFAHKRILVYPKVLSFRNLYINRIGNLESGIKDKRKTLTNQSLSEVKAFEYGEKLSLIHWKISTRLGKLMSKKMESITDEKYSVYIDLRRAELGNEENIVLEDKLIELFVAFINVVMSNNIPVVIKYMQSDIYTEESYKYYSQFDIFYESAAKMQFTKTTCLADILQDNHVKLSDTSLSQGKIFVFTFDLSVKLMELLELRVGYGFSVFLFYVSKKGLVSNENADAHITEEDELINMAGRLGIKLYRADVSDDINHLLEGEVI